MNEQFKMQSDNIEALISALVLAQADLKHSEKDAKNSHFQNDYSTLESVIDATRQTLAKQGIVVLQPIMTLPDGKTAVLYTMLAHTSGQYICSMTPIINTKGDAQGFGSATTYARRYSLSAIMNISQTDDDGIAASGRPEPRSVPSKKGKSKDTPPVDEF